MNLKDFNEKLRASIKGIQDAGFRLSDICKLLTGVPSSHMSKFLRDKVEFGIKPITKITGQAGYTVHIVALSDDDDNQEFLDLIDSKNERLFKDLKEDSITCLNERHSDTIGQVGSRVTVVRATIDEMLSDLDL